MLSKILAKAIDSFGFTIALVVQLGVMTVSMSLLGYQIYMKAGFISIGWVVVLFAVRAWLKGPTIKNRLLWAMFALVSIFFSWSFALVGTEAQTQATVKEVTIQNDTMLKTIQVQLIEARGERSRLSGDYTEAFRGETVDSILDAQKENSEGIQNLEEKEMARLELIESGELTEQKRAQAGSITADKIFSAIPDTIKRGQWLRLIIFGLIFIGLEITIVTAVEEQREIPEPETSREGEPSEILTPNPIQLPSHTIDPTIQKYADVRWIENGKNLLSRSESIAKMGNPEAYQKITEKSLRLNLIKTEKGGKTFPNVSKAVFLAIMSE